MLNKTKVSIFLIVTLCCNLQACVLVVPFLNSADSLKVETPSNISTTPTFTTKTISLNVPVTHRVQPKKRLTRKRAKVQKLVKKLKDKNEIKRTYAAGDLGLMGQHALPAVGFLISSLDDNSKYVRRVSAQALGKIRSSRAVPALIKSLRDRDQYVAYSAARALQKIGTTKALQAVNKYRKYWRL